MKHKKLNILTLKNLINKIKSNSKEAIGSFLFKSFRIQVSRYNLSTSQRVSQLYHKRREQGLCIQCGKKVKKKNPKTKKLYRLCEYHREKIDRKQHNLA